MYRKAAFTLIELLVVISIITILMGILLPSLSRAKEMARRSVCASNLKSAGVGFRMYLNESNDVMPAAAAMPSMHLNTDPRIADVLAPFLSQPEVLRCPSDTHRSSWQFIEDNLQWMLGDRPQSQAQNPYYETEGSSYEYNTRYIGRKIDTLTRPYAILMHDYIPFHGAAGTSGSANYLYADFHVSDLR